MKVDRRYRQERGWWKASDRTHEIVRKLRLGVAPAVVASQVKVSRNWVYVIRAKLACGYWADMETR